MTERLADINTRIDGIGQLGVVVNAMRAIAAARAQQARDGLIAVDSYAGTIAAAIGHVLTLVPEEYAARRTAGRKVLLVFAGEEGFVGNFSERVLESAAPGGPELLFLVGSRGAQVAAGRDIKSAWAGAMPAHTSGVPRLADTITTALYGRMASGEIDRMDVVFSRWSPATGLTIDRQSLLPLDNAAFGQAAGAMPPLLNLKPLDLLDRLTADYLHAEICHAALHAFAAENEARMQAMAAARREIDRQLEVLQRRQRILRQDQITAEIIELVSGAAASSDQAAAYK